MQNIFDLIREDEEKSLLQARKEIAQEMEDWQALSQEQKNVINKAREDKYANTPDEIEEEDTEEDE